MSEEQKMILNMVAEGKITPDEGVTLLDAIKDKRTPTAPEIEIDARRIVDDPFKEAFDTSPKSAAIAEGSKLFIDGRLGVLHLIGTDEADVKVSGAPRAQYKMTRKGDTVNIKSRWPGGNLTVYVPKGVTKLTAKSHTGQITAKNLPNTLTDVDISTHTGHIVVSAKTLVQGNYRIQSKVGQTEFYLPPESACSISAACRIGEIDCDLPLTITEEGFGFLKGSLNNGGANIQISSKMGQIIIGPKS